MTRLPGVNVSLGAVSVTTKFKFSDEGSTGPGGIPLGSDSGGNAGSTAPIPNAYVSFQLSPDWFAGLGISAPFGLSTEYNDDWIGRYQSTRSEEHTSELQSLMRISYAVFCLKKKNNTQSR